MAIEALKHETEIISYKKEKSKFTEETWKDPRGRAFAATYRAAGDGATVTVGVVPMRFAKPHDSPEHLL